MTTELPKPTAKRLQRPSWRDSRLVLGVLLVLVAATLGARVVASADDRVPMYVASRDLVAGDPVDASSFTPVDVQLGSGVAGQTRVGHRLDGRMPGQELGHGEGGGAVAVHAQGQRLDPPED